MPKQGQSVETCVLLEWMKKKGARVKQGDILFAYETDKASFEFESPVSGVLLETFFNAQDEVPIHTAVAVVGEPGENVEKYRPQNKNNDIIAKPSSTQFAAGAATLAVANVEKPVSPRTEGPGVASPRARRKAHVRGIDLAAIRGTGPRGRIIECDVLSHTPLTRTAAAHRAAEGLVAPPESEISGSRIRAADLLNEQAMGSAASLEEGVTEERLSNVRHIIGSRMLQSLQQSAQLTMNAFADATALLACRKQLKADGKDDITVTDLVALAVTRTLPAFTELNGIYKDDKFYRYAHVHLAMAVDTTRGLMVPVVKSADLLPLEKLSASLKERAAQCREGSINPDLLAGGTITLSNLGMFGIDSFTPILNPPQVAILGINTIAPRPVETEKGDCAVRPHIGFSLTIDHRVVDGAPAARFLKKLCENIATIDAMLAQWK
jgi:pyruvate dehydrogenase E2 component (dihydrolipoamide acetyltransferase)